MFSRLNTAWISAALLAGAVSGAHAEGLYIGGSLGVPDYSSRINGIDGGSGDGGAKGTGLKAYGGYQLTPNFALEAGGFRLGQGSDGTGSVRTHGVYLDGVGSYMFAPSWSVLGSFGVAEGHFTTTAGDDSSPALKLGAGLQYDLSRQVALRLQYDRYRFSNVFDAKPEAGAYSFGVKLTF